MDRPGPEGRGAMEQGDPSLASARGDRVRLRTLILLRWMAAFGQVVAIVVAWQSFGIAINIVACLLVVLASVAVNLVFIFAFPQSKRVTETEAILALLFDTLQLAVLLGLTGGLNNPFALLFLAPVTIAATAYRTRAILLVGGAAVVSVSFVALFHVPLRTHEGTLLAVPALFSFGFWLAIMTGIAFIALYARRVAFEIRSMGDALLATQMALAREQKLTDLGGVVAAAAHELGTPLATIKLVGTELASELKDRPELLADAELIREQADRCRDILRSMGRAGKDDLHLRSAPISSVLQEAAEPHLARGKSLHFALKGVAADQPMILRKPEIIHGLRNLIQNAVDFSRQEVWIEAGWTDDAVSVRIADDGAGFPLQMIGRIGDPFMRSRREDPRLDRPEYDGMGLGLFIAKTLLERTGADLRFANGSDPFLTEEERPRRSGAIIDVAWPRVAVEPTRAGGLGDNVPFKA